MQEDLDKQITDNVPEFFFIWDIRKQKIVYLTQGYRDYSNFKLERLEDYERMVDFVHPDERQVFKKVLSTFSKDHAFQDHDFRVNNENYSATWMNLRTFPIEDKQGTVYRIVAHISDISDRKAQLSEMEALNERNEEIVRMLAHDLKNPLFNIQGVVMAAEDSLKAGKTDEVLNFLHILKKSSFRSLHIIRSMLEMLELSGANMTFQSTKTDLKQLVNNMLMAHEDQFERCGITVIKEFTEDQVQVLMDAEKFQHVIDNLISNAMKFTPDGGTVTVRISCNSNVPILEIEDTGVGIDLQHQEEIFKEFSSARRRGVRGENSTGLGLSIAKKIVELHDGTISVRSMEGEGTCFTIRMKSQ